MARSQRSFSLMFASRKFMLPVLPFKSIIYFNFIFLYGVREGLMSFCCIWVNQYNCTILKRLFFLHLISIVLASKINWLYMWGTFLDSSVPLNYMSILTSVLNFFAYFSFYKKLVNHGAKNDLFLFSKLFDYFKFFSFLYKF